jgi:hypothetical protein
MIKIETIAPNIDKVTPSDTLKADDFQQIAPLVDELIHQHGKIRLLLDTRQFHGWENMAAFEKHMGFVKAHHKSIVHAAVIAGHVWQHWLAGTVRLFVRPEIRAFDKESEAVQWISGGAIS